MDTKCCCLKTPQFYRGSVDTSNLFITWKTINSFIRMNATRFSLYLQNSLLKTADVCQHIWKPLLITFSSSGKAVACTHGEGFISDHTNACNHLCFTLIFIIDCITLLPYYSRMPFEAVVRLSCIKCGLEKASTLQKCNKLDCRVLTTEVITMCKLLKLASLALKVIKGIQ